jgi:hypothetical protein
VGVGEFPVDAGLGEVGEAAGLVGDGLVGVGEGLARRVVWVGVGVGVGVGDDTCVSFDPFDPFDPDDALAGRTSR